ncbi:unnamed protein product, partial [Prorocentrum cordatum]
WKTGPSAPRSRSCRSRFSQAVARSSRRLLRSRPARLGTRRDPRRPVLGASTSTPMALPRPLLCAAVLPEQAKGCAASVRPGALRAQHALRAPVEASVLFDEVLRFFQSSVPADIRLCDPAGLTMEVLVMEDYRPVDIAVGVTPAEGGGAKAAFTHKTMTDITRFHLVVQAAERTLAPDSAPPFCEMLDFDFPED